MTEKRDLEKFFCPAPWESAVIHVQGGTHLCSCSAWIPEPVGNLRDEEWESVWNGPRAQAVRESILDGSYRYCDHHTCPHLNAASDRLQPIDSVRDPEHLDIIRNRRLTARRGPKFVQLAYDSSCNLVCPSCRSEHIVLRGEPFEDAKRIHSRVMADGLSNVEVLEFSGQGETFASRIYLDVLRRFDFEANPNAKFHLITNGVLLTPKMWASIAHSHRAIESINVSINAGTPETFAINQKGGNWETLINNLAFIGELRHAGTIDRYTLGCYIQQNNYHEMPGLVDLAKKIGVDYLQFQTILNWGTYTEAEFHALAVHLPNHPEHGKFLEVLQNRAIRDPIALLGNLTQYLPGAGWGARPAPKAWDEFIAGLQLAEHQAERIRTHLAEYGDAFVALCMKPSVDGGASPLACFVRALPDDGGGGIEDRRSASRALVEYMAMARERESRQFYSNLANKLAAKYQGNIMEELSEEQLHQFMQFAPESVLELDIGYDPFGAAVSEALRAIGSNASATSQALATWTDLDTLAEALDLSVAQRSSVSQAIDEAKRRKAEIFAADALGGGPSTAVFLARQLHFVGAILPVVERRMANFLTHARDADTGQVLCLVLHEEQTTFTKKIAAILSSDQCEIAGMLRLATLIDAPTGSDPVGALVDARAKAIPAHEVQKPQSWNELAAWLCLEGEPREELLGLLYRLKESYTALCQQAPREGGQAPLLTLAAAVRSGARNAQKCFIRELQKEMVSGKTYLASIQEMEATARADFLGLLDDEQRDVFAGFAPISLLHLPISDDPFQAALHNLLHRKDTGVSESTLP